jgi:hypothetical protein
MRNAVVAVALCCAAAVLLWGADNLVPLNVKEGLWEVTTTHSISGAPAMAIPPDTLAKMPPEQRARIEAAMKQSGINGPATDVRKECVTKEKLDKSMAFNDNRENCKRTVVNSTASKMSVKFHCEDKQGSTDGTFQVDALGSDNAKGSMQATTNRNGQTMNMNFTFNSKYLGSDCGDIK